MSIEDFSLYKKTLHVTNYQQCSALCRGELYLLISHYFFCQDEEDVRYLLFLKVDTKRHIVGRGEVEGEKEEK